MGDLWRRSTLPRSVIGVEVGETRLCVARRRRGPGPWSLATLPIEPEDLDAARPLPRRLRELARSAKLPRGEAICALCSPAVTIFPLTLPVARSERLDYLVATQAEKHLSRPLDEVVLDYAAVPEAIRRPGESTTVVLVFAVPRTVVDGVLAGLAQLGLRVDRLITPACALARHFRSRAGDRRLLIDTSQNATSISVVQDGHVLLERILPWGRQSLLARLETELSLETENARPLLERGHDDAEQSSGSPGTDSPAGALREILAPVFRSLTGEAASCLAYGGSVFRHAPAGGAILVGALANHEPLREALKRELGLGVQGAADAFGFADRENSDVARYATAIGCALWAQGRAA
jgi:Tfp pilus assembly PilM family ATPase